MVYLLPSALCQYIDLMFRLVMLVAVLFLSLSSSALSRFDKETPSVSGRFRYHFDNPHYIRLADSILTRASGQISKLLATDITLNANIYMTETLQEFDSLIGGKFPDWGAAAAIPVWNRIVIKSPDRFQLNKSFEELLVHEYAHLALAERTGLGQTPRWFDEGFSTLVSREWSWGAGVTMSLAAVTGNLIPLNEIEQLNRFTSSRARVGYAESYLAVQYFYDLYGVEAVNIFLTSLARGSNIDAALIASTGSDYTDFNEEFRVYLAQRFNLISLVADTMYFWLALAVILIIGAVLTMRRRRKYYRKWEEEEKYASTDFDYGDPDNPEQTDDDEPWRN